MTRNPKTKKVPVNYSIKNIIASLLNDIPTAHHFSVSQKRALYHKALDTLARHPNLSTLLSRNYIHSLPIPGARYFARIGILPTPLVIADHRFQNLCCLPYWTMYSDGKGHVYRRFDRCPGYGWLPGCPPQALPVEKVYTILNTSTLMIVLQTKLLQERWQVKWKFDVLHRLARDIEKACGAKVVTGKFGSGPCSACAQQYCLLNQPCKTPALKTISLEAAGICVDRICSDLALLTGNNAWKLIWLRHFGLPEQKPSRWKYVEAITLRI